jgi:Arc/MetJ family transcription regulator
MSFSTPGLYQRVGVLASLLGSSIGVCSHIANTNRYGTIIPMRTTLILEDELVRKAMEATGIKKKSVLVHKGLEELIRKAACQRLIALGGTNPKAKATHRKR